MIKISTIQTKATIPICPSLTKMKSRKKLIIQTTIQTQKNKQKAVQRIVNSDTAYFLI